MSVASAAPVRADVLAAPQSLVDSGHVDVAVIADADSPPDSRESALGAAASDTPPALEGSGVTLAADGEPRSVGAADEEAVPQDERTAPDVRASAPGDDDPDQQPEPPDPVEPRQEPLALFRSVLILPLPRAVDPNAVAIDSSRGTVTIAPSPPSDWVASTALRVENSQIVDQFVSAEERVTMVFSSLSTTAIVVQAFPLQTRYLVVGLLRVVPNPRRHFMGPRCAASLLQPSNIELAAAISDYCGNDSLRVLARLEGTSSLPATERQVATVLRYESAAVTSEDGARRLSRLTEIGVGAQSRVAAAMATAFGQALREELPAALDTLQEAERAISGTTERAELTRVTIRDFGFALFERLMEAAHASGEPMASIYYAERFADWNVERLPASSRRRLGDAYGALNMPLRAASLYLSAYSAGPEDDYALLAQLAESYHDAGDRFRAVETVEFLRERAPDAAATRRVGALLGEEPGQEQTQSCAERAQSAEASVDLFAALHCARDAGDRALLEAISERLLEAEQVDPVFGEELTELLVREALRSVSDDRRVR